MATKGYGPAPQLDTASSIAKHIVIVMQRLPQLKPSQEIISAIAACAPTTTGNFIDLVALNRERVET